MLRRVPCLFFICSLFAIAGLSPLSGASEMSKKYALLVGVNNYDHDKLPTLKYAENDVADLADVLRKAGYEVMVLSGAEGKKQQSRQPTKANIQTELAALLKKFKKGDTIVLGFSGHGLQFDKECYFCPRDAQPFKEKTESLLALSAIYQELEQAVAGTKIMLVDACRNDPTPGRSSRGIDADSAPPPPKGVAALFSCSAGQRAFESDQLKHGVFFHYVLEALKGKAGTNDKGEVTWGRLTEYVPEKVQTQVPKLIGQDVKQTPNMKADLVGLSPVLVRLDNPRTRDNTVVEDQPKTGTFSVSNAVKSVVWIYSPRGNGWAATGTGSLVDTKLKLILTNYHIVGDGNTAVVMFPAYKGNKIIAERDYYREHLKTDGIRGKVVARDKKTDLALIQLESIPNIAVAFTLAKEGATLGQNVHSIGNPGGSEPLWVYTSGKIRQVYLKKWKAQLSENQIVTFEANVVETDWPPIPGDGGGPVFNDRGEIVAVRQGGASKDRLISTCIDVVEVKHFLLSKEVRGLGTLDVPKRAIQVLAIKDEAKFFSPDVLKKANEDITELIKRYHLDLAIETFATVPDDQAEKVKAMLLEERAAYFRNWSHERMREEQVDGIYLLICKQPSHLTVEIPARLESMFNENAKKELADLLLSHFREKKYDEGLTAAVKFVSEKLSKSKEK